MSGPEYVEDSSSDEEGPPPSSQSAAGSATDLSGVAREASIGADGGADAAGRIDQLQRELEEARKAQRALAAKLVQGKDGERAGSAGKQADQDHASSISIASTITGLEEELEAMRRNLEFKNYQVAAVAQEMAKMQREVEEATRKASEMEATKEVAVKQSEEEVERLQEELSTAKARSEMLAATAAEREEERQRREAALLQEAKEEAASEWKRKMEAIQQQYEGRLAQKDAEVAQHSSKAVPGAAAARDSEEHWGAKLADKTVEAGQVKAEFDSFKSMTRRVMKEKDEELKRLLKMEEGMRVRGSSSASLSGLGDSLSQSARDNRMLDSVQTMLAKQLEDPQANRNRVIVLGFFFVVFMMVYFLYQTYKSAGSLLCFLDLIGLELFGGCHHAATLAKKLAKNNDFTPFVLNSTHMGIS